MRSDVCDCTGYPLLEGHVVTYPVRASSAMWMVCGVVKKVHPDGRLTVNRIFDQNMWDDQKLNNDVMITRSDRTTVVIGMSEVRMRKLVESGDRA